jgi:glycosyltransferase involved in cell wall biosynthesis
LVKVFIYTPPKLGGFERRFLRIFSYIDKKYPDIKIEIVCIGKNSEANFIKHKDNLNINISRVVFVNNKINFLFYLLQNDAKVFIYSCDGFFMELFLGLWSKIKKISNICVIATCKVFELDKKSKYLQHNNKNSTKGSLLFDIKRKLSNNLFFLSLKLACFIDTLYPRSSFFLKNIFHSKKITVTPGSFTDLEKFRPCLTKKKKIVFLSARLDFIKNPYLMLNAAELISEKLRENSYLIYMCGEGPEKDNIIRLAVQKNIEDIVVFPGYIQPELILPDAEVFCSIQLIENYPSQALLEAISCGCYIIATNVGDTKKILDESFSKIIPNEPEALADAILDYMSFDFEIKKNIIKLSRDFAERNFRIEPIAEYYVDLIKKVSPKM